MKTLQLITHRETRQVLYSCFEDSLSKTVERALQGKVNLRWADLRWADLRRAKLSEANLRGADLRGADLSGADLSEADLWDLGTDRRGYRFLLLFDKDAKTFTITAGCRCFNLAEARKHWAARHQGDAILLAETLGRVALAEAIAASVPTA